LHIEALVGHSQGEWFGSRTWLSPAVATKVNHKRLKSLNLISSWALRYGLAEMSDSLQKHFQKIAHLDRLYLEQVKKSAVLNSAAHGGHGDDDPDVSAGDVEELLEDFIAFTAQFRCSAEGCGSIKFNKRQHNDQHVTCAECGTPLNAAYGSSAT
jgi:hypothetical protein